MGDSRDILATELLARTQSDLGAGAAARRLVGEARSVAGIGARVYELATVVAVVSPCSGAG